MSRIRTQVDELRNALSNAKLSKEDRSELQEKILDKQEILRRLDVLNKAKLKRLGVADEEDDN